MPEINPVYGSYFDIQTYIPASSANLNLTQDTIDATSQSSVNIQLDASNPNLSIFGFGKLVSSAIRENKSANDKFDLDEAGMYRDFHRNVATTAAQLREEIDALRTYRDNYNAYIDKLNAFNDTVQGRVDNLQNTWNNLVNGKDFFFTWDTAADFAILMNNAVTTTAEETQDFLDAYALWVARYNARVDQLNGTIQTNTINGINNYINIEKPGLQATADTLNTLYNQLGLTSPTVDPIPSLNAFSTYGTYSKITVNIPPPYPAGLYFDPLTDYRYYEPRGPIPYPPVNDFGQTVNGPYFPENPVFDVPHPINHDIYQEAFIRPRLDLLEEMKRAQKRVQNAIDFQQAFRPDFGQVAISAPMHVPVGSPATSGGAVGSSNVLSGIAANQGQNVRFDEQFAKAQLETVYNLNGVPAGSPLVANVDGYAEDILGNLLAPLSVPAGINLSQGALVGGTPGESPAVGAGIALATLENTLQLVGSDAIYKALFNPNDPNDKGILLERALSDPANKEKSEATLRAELEPLARGIAAAINLQLVKMVVLQVEAAIGVSGLLPQILANLGSVSTDSIIQFVNGLINYKHLFDSPRDTQLVAITFRDYFEEVLALGRQQAELIVGRALNEVARQGPYDTEEAAKTALREALVRSAAEEDIADAAPIVDGGFDRLEATPEQQLLTDLKAEAFLRDVKAELLRSHLEQGEAARIANRLDVATAQARSLEDRRAIVESLLAEEGIDQAPAIIERAVARAESPIYSGFITEVAPREVVTHDLGTAIADLFTHQAVRHDIAVEQGERYSNLVFNNPISIASIIERNLDDYARAVGITQTEAADATFRDTQQIRLSTSAYLAHIVDPANRLVYLSNPIIYGDLQPRVGPAGGVVTNPVISI